MIRILLGFSLLFLRIFVLAQSSFGQDNCELKFWFLDQDGDRYYSRDTLACNPEGSHWTLTSFLGIDPEDKNPFYPFGYQFLFSIEKIKCISGKTFWYYQGKVYSKDSVWIHFLEKDFPLEKVILEDGIPLPYIKQDSLYASLNMPFKGTVIRHGKGEEILFSSDTVEITSNVFKKDTIYDLYKLDNLVPKFMDPPANSKPGMDLISAISDERNAELRDLIFSDIFYFQLWGVLYSYPKLRSNVEVLKILNPPTRKRSSGIHRDYHPKDFLMKEVAQTEYELHQKNGIAHGNGKRIKRRFLKDEGLEYLPVPAKIARKIRGEAFDQFDDFQKEIWNLIDKSNRYSNLLDSNRYSIRYIMPLYKTLDAYDMDNMIFTTDEYYLDNFEPVSKLGIW